ncbi:hypothetical protein SUGI_0875100 [Cryptomeria japonica]|nr:hypothetical protein SUGI_0875100 [Cryptomeria japonica]
MSPVSFWMNLTFVLAMLLQMTYPFTNGCPPNERNYLLDFRGGLLDPTGHLSSWQGYNCCEWKGIRCDFHSGHVIKLDLRNSFAERYGENTKILSGAIHPSLFDLQHLQHLDLGLNDFNNTSIPPQLAKLQNLTFLSLAYAGFGGEVPLELGNITTLRHLDLSVGDDFPLESTRFAEWIKIQNLRSLEYLAMNFVNLSMANDDWSNALSSLSYLREIHFRYCGLSGTLPSLLNITHLSHLDLSSNSFSSILPAWFRNVSSLVSLDLFRCGLHGSIPSNFLSRSRLRKLDLSDNLLEGNLSFIRYQSSSIAHLNLQSNSLDGIIPLFFANFTELKYLLLANNYLAGEIPPFGSTFGKFLPLSLLNLSQNKLMGNIPPSIGCLPLLRSLNLENNYLSRRLPDAISKPARFEELKLSSNNLTGSFSLSLKAISPCRRWKQNRGDNVNVEELTSSTRFALSTPSTCVF